MDEKQIKQKSPCLICGNTTARMSRGLCSAHYQRFHKRKDAVEAELGKEAAEQWEAKMIADGHLLPAGEKIAEDPLDVAFDEFMREMRGVSTTTREQLEMAERLAAEEKADYESPRTTVGRKKAAKRPAANPAADASRKKQSRGRKLG